MAIIPLEIKIAHYDEKSKHGLIENARVLHRDWLDDIA